MPSAAHTARNGQEPLKRGRGRPPKPRVPIEAFDDQMFIAAMREADAIERTRTMAQLVAEQERAGLHPAAFATARKLVKRGPEEAQAFYAALTKYLAAAGLIAPARSKMASGG